MRPFIMSKRFFFYEPLQMQGLMKKHLVDETESIKSWSSVHFLTPLIGTIFALFICMNVKSVEYR